MIRSALTVACAAVLAGPLLAQAPTTPDPIRGTPVPDPSAIATTDTPATDSAPSAESGKPSRKAKKAKAPKSPWTFETFTRYLFDGNLYQDRDSVSSHGLIAGMGIRYQADGSSGDWELAYHVARHSYTNSETWDRTTHDLEASYDLRLSRRWTARTTGEVALKDASDDGDIRDAYTLEERLEYRINPVHRVRLEAALRQKKYQDDPGRDASAPYVGIAFDQRWSGGRRFLVGYRYEDNRADEARRSYRRSTWNTLLARDLTPRDAVSLEARYRLVRYTERLVSTGGPAEPRRDRRWQVEAAWDHTLWNGVDLRLDYEFENRRSNDARRKFDDHLVGATLTRRW